MSSHDVRKLVDAAVESALSRLRPELVESVLASLPADEPKQAVAATSTAGGPGAGALRRDLFAAMDGTGQVEILNSLMASITQHWDRAVLFLVKGSGFQPWDARGFDGGIGNAAAKQVAVAAEEDTILSAALSGSGAQSANHLLDALGAASGSRAAVPLGIRNKAAAVLYVDGPKGGEAEAVAAMEIVARVAAQSIELGMFSKRVAPFVRCEAVTGTARSAAAPAVARVVATPAVAPEVRVAPTPAAAPTPAPPAAPTPAPAPAASAESGFAWGAAAASEVEVEVEPEYEVEVEAEEKPAAARATPAPAAVPAPAAWPSVPAPAPSPEPSPAAAPEPAPTPRAWPSAPPAAPVAPVAVAAARAAPSAEAPEAVGMLDPKELLKGGAKPVVDAGQSLGAPKVSSRWKPVREQMKSPDAVDPALAAIPEAERGKHADARKIARLLVSEIKLYNEAKVAVGRKNKDLYERLKEDIERSRQTYLQRIDPDVAAKSNYFHEELVSTLAEGDADVLGKAAH